MSMNALLRYDYPGKIRKYLMEALVLIEDNVIHIKDLLTKFSIFRDKYICQNITNIFYYILVHLSYLFW